MLDLYCWTSIALSLITILQEEDGGQLHEQYEIETMKCSILRHNLSKLEIAVTEQAQGNLQEHSMRKASVSSLQSTHPLYSTHCAVPKKLSKF